MLKAIIILIALVGVLSQAIQPNTDAQPTANEAVDEPFDSFAQFNQYMAHYGKAYSSMDEFSNKLANFLVNAENIKSLNNGTDGETAAFSHTQYSDLHPSDFKSKMLTFQPDDETLAMAAQGGYFSTVNGTFTPESSSGPHRNLKGGDNTRLLANAPASYDWRNYGVVQIVKDQGQCGGCWAFASTGNIESAYAIKHGTLYNLSEQQLMDCDYTNNGCVGGSMANAFSYLMNYGYGLETTYNYGKYLAYKATCRAYTNMGLAKVTGYYYPGTNEATIAQYLWAHGPVSIAINADPLQYYSSGIINLSKAACPSVLDHAVQIVGYGSSNGLNYWIVKNSWGPYFGEKGYFRIVRGYGVCGLNLMAISATVA